MNTLAERGVKQSQRILALYLQHVGNGRLDLLYRFGELRFFFCGLEFSQERLRGADLVGNLNDAIENPILLALNRRSRQSR